MSAPTPPTRPQPGDTLVSEGDTIAERPPRFRALAWINASLLAVLAIAMTAYLWPHWLRNPDLSHGLLMPVVFLLLIATSRKLGSVRPARGGAGTVVAVAAFGALALAALVAAGLFAVSLGWSHSLVGFTLTAAFAVALVAALAAFSAEPLRVVTLNWPALAAIALWLLAAPMPPGTYSRVTLALQSWVTGRVITTLHFLGVAARQHGNLIELAGATVGVEEACSGIRSLLACVFAGVFLSALLLRSVPARLLLVALAAPLAIAMNLVRSLTLTLLANSGVDIRGAWHDATGYAILLVTAALLGGLALLLERKPAPQVSPKPARLGSSGFAPQLALGAVLVSACAVAAFFVLHSRPAATPNHRAPDLAGLLPAEASGWTVVTTPDLYRFADTLQTNALIQRTYVRGEGDAFTQITFYLAFWPPGQASVSNVALHTPDACWPGTGWDAEPSQARRFTGTVAGHDLPPAEARVFFKDEIVQHVWFWHLVDRVSVTQADPRSARELLAIAWRYGFRTQGEQVFVRVSSNRTWDAIGNDPLVVDVFTRLRSLGL